MTSNMSWLIEFNITHSIEARKCIESENLCIKDEENFTVKHTN